MVDRRNPKRYRVDLSFLPKMPSGSLVACGSLPRGERDRPAGIFISHAEPDGQTVHRLAQELKAAGLTVWTEGGEAGDPSYEEQVIHAIDEAPLFLLTLSPESVVSHRVRTELDVALSKAKRVITVVLRRTISPEEMDYALVGAQHLDLSQDFELGLLRLLDTIERKTPEQTVAPETLLTTCADALGGWYRASQSLMLAFLGQFILAPALLLLHLGAGESLAQISTRRFIAGESSGSAITGSSLEATTVARGRDGDELLATLFLRHHE